MRKIIIAAFFIITALCGCAHDPFVETINCNLVTLSASFEQQVKTMVMDGGAKVYWEAAEEIKVFSDTDSAKFTSANNEPAAVADFTGYLDLQEGERIVALYPYESRADIDSDGLSVILPNRQIGRAGTFSRNTNISVAVSHDKTLFFQNVCGGIRFTLGRNDITSVDLEGLGNEVLAGEVKLSLSGETPVPCRNIAGRIKVTLFSPEGETFESDKWYYITTFPVELTKGVKMTFHTSDGKTGVAQSNAPLEIKRSIYAQIEYLDSKVLSWDTGDEEDEGEDLSVCTMEVEIPETADPDYVSRLVVRNAYGEYPLKIASGEDVKTKAGDEEAAIRYNTDYLFNASGNMFNFLTDPINNNVVMSSISKPEKEAHMNATSTALTLLMSNHLLITSDPDQMKATQAALMSLNAFWDYVAQVRELSERYFGDQICPDYRSIDQVPVLAELIRKGFENAEVPQDALYISNVHSNGGIIGFHLLNNYKRVVHVYGRRVKMYDNNLIVKDEEEICFSFADILKSLQDEHYIPDHFLIKKEIDQYKELVDAIKEIRPYLDQESIFDGELDFPFPYICNSGSAKYGKIVGAAVENLAKNGQYWRGNESSIYESNHDIKFDIDDYDKLFVDVYGIGRGMRLLDGTASDEELMRMMFVLVHGGYYDVIKPFIDLVEGIESAEKTFEHKYDLRYGARKAPTVAFLGKLAKNFKSKGVKELIVKLDDFEKADCLDALEYVGHFVRDQVFESVDTVSYWNLLYNIYKKDFGISSTSSAFRKAIKSAWRDIGIASTTINLSNLIMNAGGGVWGAMYSHYKNTFIIDEAQFPYIDVISPHGREALKGENIVFKWAMHKSNSIGYRTYDLDIEIVDENLQKHTYRYPDLIGTEFGLPSNTFPDLAKAVSAKYRITAKSAMVGNDICQTEWIDMLEDYKNVPDVPGYNL